MSGLATLDILFAEKGLPFMVFWEPRFHTTTNNGPFKIIKRVNRDGRWHYSTDEDADYYRFHGSAAAFRLVESIKRPEILDLL